MRAARGRAEGFGWRMLWLSLLLVALPAPSNGNVGPGGGNLVINVGVNEHRYSDPDEAVEGTEDTAEDTDVKVAIFQQTISGNSSTDTVTIDYVEVDGTRVTQLTDFRMFSQVTRVILLGEEELNEPAYQVLCFVSAFSGDMIAPEAVMKLRQKHPGTVRVAESDEGQVVQDSPLVLRSWTNTPSFVKKTVSSHLPSLCRDARKTTFTSDHEVHSILQHQRSSSAEELAAAAESLAQPYPNYQTLERCSTMQSPQQQMRTAATACQCTREVEFYWYPCALKYCRNQDSEGEHRCGIKTCKKTVIFRYPVKSKLHCMWDIV